MDINHSERSIDRDDQQWNFCLVDSQYSLIDLRGCCFLLRPACNQERHELISNTLFNEKQKQGATSASAPLTIITPEEGFQIICLLVVMNDTPKAKLDRLVDAIALMAGHRSSMIDSRPVYYQCIRVVFSSTGGGGNY